MWTPTTLLSVCTLSEPLGKCHPVKSRGALICTDFWSNDLEWRRRRGIFGGAKTRLDSTLGFVPFRFRPKPTSRRNRKPTPTPKTTFKVENHRRKRKFLFRIRNKKVQNFESLIWRCFWNLVTLSWYKLLNVLGVKDDVMRNFILGLFVHRSLTTHSSKVTFCYN